MVVEDAQTGYVGAVVRIEYGRMELEDRRGRRKPFPIGPGYLIDGKPVILTAPQRSAPTAPARTASGSVAVPGEGQSRTGKPDLRRRPARRRTGRAGVGRRSARRGRGGRIPRRRRRSRRHRQGFPARPGASAWRPRRPPRRRLEGSPHRRRRPSRARRGRTHWSSVIRSSTSGRRSSRRGSASRRGRWCRVAWTGRRACARHWAGRTPSRPTPRGRGSGSAAGVRDWNDLEPALIGRVEELIDFVTQPAS